MSGRADGYVLVVDDYEDLRWMIAEELKDRGFTVRTANGGLSALTEMVREKPRVVLLDLMMPDLDGWQVRARMLENEELRGVPVIVVSASPLSRKEITDLAVAGFIGKPFRMEHLEDEVVRVLGLEP